MDRQLAEVRLDTAVEALLGNVSERSVIATEQGIATKFLLTGPEFNGDDWRATLVIYTSPVPGSVFHQIAGGHLLHEELPGEVAALILERAIGSGRR